jgi:hypothetical protein
MYFSGQSRHFIWYMPLSLYLSFCGFCFTMFCVVFLVLNTIVILVISECGPFWFLVVGVQVIVSLLSLWGWVFHNLVCVVFVVV